MVDMQKQTQTQPDNQLINQWERKKKEQKVSFHTSQCKAQ